MSWKQRTTNTRPLRIDTPATISPALLNASAAFGILPKNTRDTQPKQTLPNDEQLRRILDQRIVLLRGSSGSGKSSLLRGIESRLQSTSHRLHIAQTPHRQHESDHTSMLDTLGGDLASRVSALASAGLGEPKLWALPYSCLSVGQQSRLVVAQTMQHAKRGDVVLVDEFATPLDRISAYSFARTMRRWAMKIGVTLICATAHNDIEGMLEPDLVIDLDFNAWRKSFEPNRQAINIEAGTFDDYKQLSHLHYLGAAPATRPLILRALRRVDETTSILAGVMVVSMPTLNGSWRDRAWPGFFTSSNKSDNARLLNKHLRSISRVIVEPRSRGLGIATQLVRAYLERPQTPASEAVAAMGSVCPFFEHAGMQSYDMPPTPIDLRLLDALDHLGLDLIDLISNPIEERSFLANELLRWARNRKLVDRHLSQSEQINEAAPIAACRLISRPRAYAHTKIDFEEDTGVETHGEEKHRRQSNKQSNEQRK